MPRSDAIPVDQSTGRSAAQPVDQPAPTDSGFFNPFAHTVGENLARLQQTADATGVSSAPDFARVAGNALGLGDWLHSTVTGLAHPFNPIKAQKADLEAQQAQTAQSSKNIGPAASVAANLVGSLPLAGVGTGATTADALISQAPRVFGSGIGRYGAGVIGSTAENAATAAGVAAAKGEDPVAAAKWGGIFGFGGGLGGGIATPKAPPRGPLASTEDLKTAASALHQPLENIHFDPADVDRAFNGVGYNLSKGDQAGMSPALKGATNDISRAIGQGGSITADDIAKFQRLLAESVRSSSDKRLATLYSNGLNDVLTKSRPLTGALSGQAKGMVDQANNASRIANVNEEIEQWLKNPASAPGKIEKTLADQPQFYQSPAGLSDALTGVSKMRGSAPVNQYLAHHIGGGLVGEGINALTGEHLPWWGAIGAGFGAGSLLKGGANAIQSARISNALKNAQSLAQTGRAATTPSSSIGDFLRALTHQAAVIGPSAASQ